jgi:hypothetical protein
MRKAVPLSCSDRLPAVMPSLGVRRCRRKPPPAARGDVEFVGHDLRQRGEDALAEFHLAGEHGDGAVRADAQPGVEASVGVEAAGQGRRRLRVQAAEREQHEQRAALQQGAARDGGVHHSALSAAARRIALRMRVWVPQRQRLSAIALRIWSSLGAACGPAGLGGEDHPRAAVAALRGLLLDEGALQRVRPLRRAERFQRDVMRRCARGAGGHRARTAWAGRR